MATEEAKKKFAKTVQNILNAPGIGRARKERMIINLANILGVKP